MSDNVYMGLDLLIALCAHLKKDGFDNVCLTTDPGIDPDGPPALFVKAVKSSAPGSVVNYAAVQTEESAEKYFRSGPSVQ